MHHYRRKEGIRMKFDDKVTLVTGSGNGIGRAIAMAFAHAGASLIVTDINKEAADETTEEIKRAGGKAVSFEADVSSGESVAKLFSFVEERFGHIDILVNNVGSTIRKPIIHFTEEEWDFVYDTNIKSM